MKVKAKSGSFQRKPQGKEAAGGVLLPDEKTKPLTQLFDYVMLLFGLKKIGKTSMLAELGDGFFIPFEAGTKALSLFQPVDEEGERKTLSADEKGWEEFKQYCRLVKKSKRFPFIVLDPVDKAHKACTKYVCKENGWDHPSDAGYGKGWAAVADEFNAEMDSLMACGKGVFLISHATDRSIKTRTGDEYNLITSTMSNQAREAIEGVVDIWAYYRYEGQERKLTILGDDHIGAGHRIGDHHFKYTDGKKIRDIDMGSSAKQSAENLLLAFNNKLENPKGGGHRRIKVKVKH